MNKRRFIVKIWKNLNKCVKVIIQVCLAEKKDAPGYFSLKNHTWRYVLGGLQLTQPTMATAKSSVSTLVNVTLISGGELCDVVGMC